MSLDCDMALPKRLPETSRQHRVDIYILGTQKEMTFFKKRERKVISTISAWNQDENKRIKYAHPSPRGNKT